MHFPLFSLVLLGALCPLFAQTKLVPDTVKSTQTSKLKLPPVYRIEGNVVAADTINRRLVIQSGRTFDTLQVEATTLIIRGVKKQPLGGLAPRELVSCSYEIRHAKKFALRIATRRTSVAAPARPKRPEVRLPSVFIPIRH